MWYWGPWPLLWLLLVLRIWCASGTALLSPLYCSLQGSFLGRLVWHPLEKASWRALVLSLPACFSAEISSGFNQPFIDIVSLLIKSSVCFKLLFSFTSFSSKVPSLPPYLAHPLVWGNSIFKVIFALKVTETNMNTEHKIRLTHRQDIKPPQGKTRLMALSVCSLLTDTLYAPVDSNV